MKIKELTDLESHVNSLFIEELVENLVSLNPEYISFELTTDSSIFFQSIIKNKTVYLELFFEENEERLEVELITNVYHEGKPILAYGGTIEDTFNRIKEKI